MASSIQHDSFLSLLDSMRSKPEGSTQYLKSNNNSVSPSPRSLDNIFDKLHYESVEIKNRHIRREFQSKKNRQNQERLSCTFRPSDTIVITLEPQAFYQKNLDWVQRKNRETRKLQCEKAEENIRRLTLTPRINKKAKEDKQNKVHRTQGVNQFLQRYKRAREDKEYKQLRINMPNGHTWNVRKEAASRFK